MPTTMPQRVEITRLTGMEDQLRYMRDCRPAGSVLHRRHSALLERLDELIGMCREESERGSLPEEKP